MNTFGSRTKPQEWVIETFPVFTVLFSFLETNVSSHLCIEWVCPMGPFLEEMIHSNWVKSEGVTVEIVGIKCLAQVRFPLVMAILVHITSRTMMWYTLGKVMESLESFEEHLEPRRRPASLTGRRWLSFVNI